MTRSRASAMYTGGRMWWWTSIRRRLVPTVGVCAGNALAGKIVFAPKPARAVRNWRLEGFTIWHSQAAFRAVSYCIKRVPANTRASNARLQAAHARGASPGSRCWAALSVHGFSVDLDVTDHPASEDLTEYVSVGEQAPVAAVIPRRQKYQSLRQLLHDETGGFFPDQLALVQRGIQFTQDTGNRELRFDEEGKLGLQHVARSE